MSGGRCAGCGLTDNSCKKVRSHVSQCPDFLKLFREDRARALDPADELRRWKAEDDSDEARSQAKDVRLQKRFQELDSRRAEQNDRWRKPQSLLDD